MSRLKRIKTIDEVHQLIAHCKATGYCSFDYETTGFDFHSPDEYPLILGISFQPGSSWIVPLAHADSPFKNCWQKVFKLIGTELFENPKVIKIAWNFKFEYKWTMQYGFKFKGRIFDAMLAKYCLDEERPHDLKSFVRRMFPEYAGYENAMKDEDGQGANWKNTDYKKLCKYCGIDADTTLRSMIFMEPKLIKLGFYSLFRNMFMMITRVLAEAEFRGMLVDREYLEGLIKEYEIKINACEVKLRVNRRLLKYEKYKKVDVLNDLVKQVQLEIAKIRKEDTPTAGRLIANREQKIKNFMEGKFNNKEAKKLEPLNFGSPKQVSDFFFHSPYGLRLKPYKYTKNKETKQESENPSTDEESLTHLAKKDKSGFMNHLLELRGLQKLDSTYISGMYPHLDRHNRIHAGFKIHGTVTGRLSCVKPNLQNIPRNTTASDIKRMFVAPPGYVLLEVDYSQAELRIIAELSKDKAMIDIFNKNYNIHVATACKLNGGLDLYPKVKDILKKSGAMSGEELARPENKELLFWEKQKKKGKSLNFSIVYQQGDDATSETLECSKEEAKEFKAEWFKQFPSVKKWIDKQKMRAHTYGYVRHMFGGKRRLDNIYSSNNGLRFEAERQAVNAPVQGSSGYFTLLSMVVIREKILKGELPRDLLSVYTVHDSIGYYVRPAVIHKVVPEIIKICDNPETMKYFGFEMKYVKMKVSAEVGRDWASITEYDPWTDYSKLITPQTIIHK